MNETKTKRLGGPAAAEHEANKRFFLREMQLRSDTGASMAAAPVANQFKVGMRGFRWKYGFPTIEDAVAFEARRRAPAPAEEVA